MPRTTAGNQEDLQQSSKLLDPGVLQRGRDVLLERDRLCARAPPLRPARVGGEYALPAIIPRPAVNLLFFFIMGSLPRGRAGAHRSSATGAPEPDLKADEADTSPRGVRSPRAWTWAALMRRVFALDVLACPRCGGRLRVLATVQDPAVVRPILAYLALAPGPDSPGPRPAPARSHRGHRVNPPAARRGLSEASGSTTGPAAWAAVCPAHTPLDDVPVARTPSPREWKQNRAVSGAQPRGRQDSRGPLQPAAGGAVASMFLMRPRRRRGASGQKGGGLRGASETLPA
jgi:uncharacterized protein YbaR (Trm112 family)